MKRILVLASQRAHAEALSAYRRAVRTGDLAKAERWLRCAERHYRLKEQARRDADEWKRHRAGVDATHSETDHRLAEYRKMERQVRAARHRKRLEAIAAGET